MRDVLIYDGKVEVIESKPWTTRAPAELPSWTTLLDAHEDAAFGCGEWTKDGEESYEQVSEACRLARYAIVARLEQLRVAVEQLAAVVAPMHAVVPRGQTLCEAWDLVYAALGIAPKAEQSPRR